MEIGGDNYWYEVTEFVTTFEKFEDNPESLWHTVKFEPERYGNSLKKAREAADEYYATREAGFDTATFFLPFASQKDFVLGENAAFSINLNLVIGAKYDELVTPEYSLPVRGEDLEEMIEGLELEQYLFGKE